MGLSNNKHKLSLNAERRPFLPHTFAVFPEYRADYLRKNKQVIGTDVL